MNDLIPLTGIDPPAIFQPGGTVPLCDLIATEARRLVPDVSTTDGREAIARMAARINRSKTLLDEIGRKYVAEIKALPKAIDAERRAMRQRLDDLKTEIRAPLDAWEAAVRARQVRFEAMLTGITDQAADLEGLSSEAIRARIEALESIEIDAEWEEYQGTAQGAKEGTLVTLDRALADAIAREEAARAQEAAAKAAAEEREALIRREAAATARAETLAEMARQASPAAMPLPPPPAPEPTRPGTETRLEERAEVHRILLADLQDFGLDADQARRLIIAIARAQIPHLAIYY